MKPGIRSAITAAVLFGASVPLSKSLLGGLPPLTLAGLLYLGSGLGLRAHGRDPIETGRSIRLRA